MPLEGCYGLDGVPFSEGYRMEREGKSSLPHPEPLEAHAVFTSDTDTTEDYPDGSARFNNIEEYDDFEQFPIFSSIHQVFHILPHELKSTSVISY